MKKIEIRRKIFPVFCWTVLLFWCLCFLFLLFWLVYSSLKTSREFNLFPLDLPKKLQLENYVNAFNGIFSTVNVKGGGTRTVYFPELLKNTLLYALGTPFFAVLSAAVASYVVAKYSRFKWVAGVFSLVIFCTYVPLSALLATNLQLLKNLGCYDSMIGMWIWGSGAFGSMFLYYYATFKGVSWAYAEAAFIDGASHFKIFVTIMLPLTKTVFGALFITSFVSIWNDYMTPMIYMPSYPTLSYAAWKVQFSTEQLFSLVPVRLAALTILLLPVLIIFIVFKNKLMGSLTLGGIKG